MINCVSLLSSSAQFIYCRKLKFIGIIDIKGKLIAPTIIFLAAKIMRIMEVGIARFFLFSDIRLLTI
jgi:hypothetical protein